MNRHRAHVRWYKPNAVRRGMSRHQVPRPTWFARGLTAGRLAGEISRCCGWHLFLHSSDFALAIASTTAIKN